MASSRVPTVTQIERAIDLEAAEWAGKCLEVATLIVQRGLVAGEAVYGHWLGQVARDSYFGARRGDPFHRHGWIRCDLAHGAVIVDPTRWAFDGLDPYVFTSIASLAPEYDEGGDRLRRAMRSPPPALSGDPIDLGLSGEGLVAVRCLLGDATAATDVRRLLWLANRPLHDLGAQAREIYDGIIRAGHGALIPIDNRRRVFDAAPIRSLKKEASTP